MNNDMMKFIGTYTALLPMGKMLSQSDAETRASQFLEAMAHVASWRHELEANRIKATSLQSAIFYEELCKCTGKTITENKLAVEASSVYATARETLEIVESDITFLKTHYEIFNNAHLFFRQMCKAGGM